MLRPVRGGEGGRQGSRAGRGRGAARPRAGPAHASVTPHTPSTPPRDRQPCLLGDTGATMAETSAEATIAGAMSGRGTDNRVRQA